MEQIGWYRRDVLRGLSVIAGAAILGASATPASAQQVKYSSGTEPPKLRVPANGCDCHHHIYGSQYKVDPRSTLRPGDATVDDYRGIRFNLAQAGATTPEMIEPLSKRVNDLGWHIQINASPETIMEIMPILEKVPSPIVFDHLAHIPEPDGINHPLFGKVRALIDKGKTWVKLSGAYADTKVGPPTYADSSAIARAYVKAAPERLVWGSDWPHPGVRDPDPKPDDAILIDLMLDWAPNEAVRNRIFADNATALYDFPKS